MLNIFHKKWKKPFFIIGDEIFVRLIYLSYDVDGFNLFGYQKLRIDSLC